MRRVFFPAGLAIGRSFSADRHSPYPRAATVSLPSSAGEDDQGAELWFRIAALIRSGLTCRRAGRSNLSKKEARSQGSFRGWQETACDGEGDPVRCTDVSDQILEQQAPPSGIGRAGSIKGVRWA